MKKTELIMLTANNVLTVKERQVANRVAMSRLSDKDYDCIRRSAKILQEELPRLSANGALELLAAIGIKIGGK